MSLFPGDPPSPLSGYFLKPAQFTASAELTQSVRFPAPAMRSVAFQRHAPACLRSAIRYPGPARHCLSSHCPFGAFPSIACLCPRIVLPSEAKPLPGTSYRCFPLPCLSASPLISAKPCPLGPHPSRAQLFLFAATALHPIAHRIRSQLPPFIPLHISTGADLCIT